MKPYYDEDGITIYHADCRDILPGLPPASLVLTDPPYGTNNLANGYGRRQLHSADGKTGRKILNDEDLSVVETSVPLLRLAQPSAVVMFCSPRKIAEVNKILINQRSLGLKHYGEIIWDKGVPGLGYSIRYSHESALVFIRGKLKKPNSAAFSLVRHVMQRDLEHPHEKPVAFWTNALKLIDDGHVVDPFCGTGSVLQAAKENGRKATGVELDERYCEIASARLSRMLNFWPEDTQESFGF